MPLLRDQKNEASVKSAAPTAANDHLHLPLKQAQSDEVPKTLSIREMDRSSKQVNVKTHISGTGGRHRLEDGGSVPIHSAPNLYKLNAPDTIQIHQNANAQFARLYPSDKKREKARVPPTTVKNKISEAQTANVFDDTASINASYLESTEGEDETVQLKPRGTNQYSAQQEVYVDPYEDNQDMGPQSTQNRAATGPYPGWEADVDDERRHLVQKIIHTPQTKPSRERGMHIEPRSQHSQVLIFGDRQEPDTPSRTRSAPPEHNVIPGKNVNFATSHQIMNPSSPSIISSEIAREDSLEQLTARPQSAQSQAQNTQVNAGTQRLLRQPEDQMMHNSVLPAYASRFQPNSHHMYNGRQENPKVSAPESDNQDFSGDERARSPQHSGTREEHPMTVQQGNLPARKRSHDDMIYELDYSPTDLKRKKLCDLQAEPFPQDPSAIPRVPPTDNMGNEMPLNQILENLSKVSGDAQRETFRTLTDEQWASTGQWFVDKFQTQLEQLMNVRLERRKIAMKYEDMIRRRQRVVEQYQTQVGNELDELQTGGRLLVDGRKVPTGSRSSTPMKGGR